MRYNLQMRLISPISNPVVTRPVLPLATDADTLSYEIGATRSSAPGSKFISTRTLATNSKTTNPFYRFFSGLF